MTMPTMRPPPVRSSTLPDHAHRRSVSHQLVTGNRDGAVLAWEDEGHIKEKRIYNFIV